MLYGLTEADLAKLRTVIAAVDRFGPSILQPVRQHRYYVDRRIKGQLTATLHSSDSSGTIDHVRLICGVSPTTSSTATVTIYNPDGASGANNDWMRAEWVISSTHGSTDEQGAWEFVNGGSGDPDSRIQGNPTAEVASTDSSFTLTNIKRNIGSEIIGVSGGNVTVLNTHKWNINATALVRAEFCPTDVDPANSNAYEAYQADCYEEPA